MTSTSCPSLSIAEARSSSRLPTGTSSRRRSGSMALVRGQRSSVNLPGEISNTHPHGVSHLPRRRGRPQGVLAPDVADLASSTSTPPATISRTPGLRRCWRARAPYSASKPETRFTSAGVETESRVAAREAAAPPRPPASPSCSCPRASTGLFFRGPGASGLWLRRPYSHLPPLTSGAFRTTNLVLDCRIMLLGYAAPPLRSAAHRRRALPRRGWQRRLPAVLLPGAVPLPP